MEFSKHILNFGVKWFLLEHHHAKPLKEGTFFITGMQVGVFTWNFVLVEVSLIALQDDLQIKNLGPLAWAAW